MNIRELKNKSRKIQVIVFLCILISNLVAEETLLLALKSSLPTERLSIGTIVITQDEIARFQGQSVRDILDSYAGIRFVKQQGELGTNTGIILRGSKNSNYALVMIDGQPINSSALGGASIEMIDIDQVERIEVIKGSLSAVLGNAAIGGAVNFIMKKHEVSHSTKVDIGSYGYQKYAVNFNIPKLNISYADTSYLGWRKNSDYYSASFFGSFAQDITDTSDINLQYIYNDSVVGVPGWGVVPENYNGSMEKEASFGYENNKNEFIKEYLQGVYRNFIGNRELYLRVFTNFDQKKDLNDNKNDYFKELKYGFETRLTFGDTLMFGYQLEYDETQKDNRITGINDYDYARAINSLYAQKTIQLEQFTSTLAIRYDNAGDYGEGISPKFSAVYQLSDNLKLSGNIASSFKTLGFYDIYAIESEGKTLDAKYEKGWGGDLGFEVNNYDKKLQLSMVFFRQEVRDIVKYYFSDDYPWPLLDVKQVSRTFSEGFESCLKLDQNILRHELNYTYSDLKIKEDSTSLYKRDAYAPHHKLVYLLDIQLFSDLNCFIKFTSVSEQQWQNKWGNSRVDDYTVTDITVTKKIADYEAYFGISNIFDEKYQVSANYPIPGRTYKAGLKFKF
ncbi:MAG: TonB-dependent receptor [bacterium]|nr:TonB-dependent receptor [bacterium]